LTERCLWSEVLLIAERINALKEDYTRGTRHSQDYTRGTRHSQDYTRGSKIQSIASMMACMIFKDRIDITPYYAVPEKYTTIPREQETIGVKKILKLPEYKIQTPPDNLIKCLEIIYQWKNYRISNKDLRDQALEKNLIHVERHEHWEQSAYMALKTNLLEPLLKWQYIKVEKIGRRHDIILTPEGLNVLKFLYTEKPSDQ
jgi:hypothetical protein